MWEFMALDEVSGSLFTNTPVYVVTHMYIYI